jgi:hypothetical protein
MGEDGRAAGQTCAVQLGGVGGEPSHAAPVWKHAAADGGFTAAAGEARQQGETNLDDGGELAGEVSEKSLRNGANHGLLILARARRARQFLWLWNKCRKRS